LLLEPMTSASSPTVPLIIGTPEQFRDFRTALRQLDFTEESICRRVGIKTIFDFKTVLEGREAGIETRDSLDVLVRLLMDEEVVDENLTALLPAGVLATMEALGVVIRMPGEPSRVYSTVVLYPVSGLYAASDRTFPPEGENYPLPADAVYAGITANTGRFLSILPEEPCEAFLDLCAGSGIAAMVAGARYARQAWAADLGLRSVHFADFNSRLNGLENVTSVQGDLYGAIGDLTFDRIAAHPPYVPAKDSALLFRDGGEDGEQILARIVQDVPRHLRPGGRFYCVTLATDREGESFEQRIRRWLGRSEAEFDVILVATEFRSRPEKFLDALVKARGRLRDTSPTTALFEKLKVTGVFYGTVVLERKTDARPAATARAVKALNITGAAVEWLRRWETAAARPGFLSSLLDSPPRLARNLSLQVTHTPQEGGLEPSKFELRASYPLVAEATIDPWVAVLIGGCDGKRTGRELFSSLRDQQVIAPTMSEDEFAGVLRLLISNGFLELEQFRLPG
jgi:SAM-dependent methyltransferase